MRPWLCVVTNRQRFGLSLPELIQRIHWLSDAGVDVIQMRERDLADRELASLVRDAVLAARGTAARVVVNDRVDVAIACEAAGVHLREDSPDVDRVRRVVPAEFVIGCSVHDAARARTLSCDYQIFGTVFPSTGKAPGHPIAGLAALREVCRDARTPVLGIGGVNLSNAADVIGAGASGIAAIESLLAVSSASHARDVVTAFRREIDGASNG